ncbi:hypothetical protein GCM10007216_00300 [Thalassobacillus devorans]|uniref:Uncharacterized protein n=1 Tax=Thalassobacillus devorans TaxID=279813 RepID=A0ABQ1NEM8_9BACI|nr:hypothetical protein GCM10007216_00300 [Thalassobacillus devorans]
MAIALSDLVLRLPAPEIRLVLDRESHLAPLENRQGPDREIRLLLGLNQEIHQVPDLDRQILAD